MNISGDPLVLFMNTQQGVKRHSLKISQVTTSRLGLLFKLKSESIYLSDSSGTILEFQEHGIFKWENLTPAEGTFLLVEGEPTTFDLPSSISSFGSAQALSRPSTSFPAPQYSPAFRSVHSRQNSTASNFSPRENANFLLRVTLGSLSTNNRVTSLGRQAFLRINEDNANTTTITKLSQEEFCDNKLKIFLNGMPVEDSAGTTGLSFWKSTGRKFFAVQVCPTNDNVETADNSSAINIRAGFFGGVKFPIATLSELWLALLNLECVICKDFPDKPVFTLCCKKILCCEDCLESAIADDQEAKCPYCRTVHVDIQNRTINGLDSLWHVLKKIKRDT